MIPLIQGFLALVLLVFQRIIQSNDANAKIREDKIKEVKDAIKSGDTSAITAALSGM